MISGLIHTVFEQQAEALGNRIAIEEEAEQISYSSLNSQSNQLSHLLTSLGIGRDKSVVVMLPSGIQLVSSMLAIFKAGGIYVPADILFARRRLQQLFRETNPQVLIAVSEHRDQVIQMLGDVQAQVPNLLLFGGSDNSLLGGLQIDSGGLIGMEKPEPELLELKNDGTYKTSTKKLSQYPVHNPALDIDNEAANYIFYTSGSTGNGKGIVGSHRSLTHYVHWHIREFNITEGDRISQLAPVTFDASLKDILPALCAGATLCIPSPHRRRNMGLLAEWLPNATVLQTVPSMFRLITRSLQQPLPRLRQVVLAGERLFGRDVTKWKEVNGTTARISNLYGLTETTILKSCYHVEQKEWQAGEVIPVGYPISNTMLAVLNEDEVCEEGEIGEIYIKTPFMTRGYLDQSLNETMFVQNPLVSDRRDIVCRTGDIGRWRSDGSLEVLGRKDEQVKIHGVRVELNEVRKAVLEVEGTEQVELVVHQDEEYGQELIAYYTGQKRTAEAWRLELSATLNEQLMPGYFVWLQEFPLNINGKVDRKQLP
ncbi:MAG TPA: amino acid adenylation domain-containing protein, partial [Chitinophagaceae bacterium]|nr:amino acid adenylation domain-containing protein [Chitinophagaceae bacterium]